MKSNLSISNNMEILQQLLERWNAPMPKFFQAIFYVAAFVVALSAGANLFIEQLVEVGFVPPKWLIDVAGWAAAAAAVVAKFTVDWKAKVGKEPLDKFVKTTISKRK